MHARAVSRALHTLLAVAVVASRTTWRAERKTTMTYNMLKGFGFSAEGGFDKGFDAGFSKSSKGFDKGSSEAQPVDAGLDSGFEPSFGDADFGFAIDFGADHLY